METQTVYTNHHHHVQVCTYIRTYVLEQLCWGQQHKHVKHSKDIRTQLGATELVHIPLRPYSVGAPWQFRLFDKSEVYTAAVLQAESLTPHLIHCERKAKGTPAGPFNNQFLHRCYFRAVRE